MQTDVSTKQNGNRKARKAMDLEHTALASAAAKTIKLADLIDNISSIANYDKKFAKTYMAEKRLLLEVLKEGDQTLWKKANSIVEDYYTSQGIA